MRRLAFLLCAIVVGGAARPALAQDGEKSSSSPSLLDIVKFLTGPGGFDGLNMSTAADPGNRRVVRTTLSGERAHPPTENPLIRQGLAAASGWAFLRDLNLQLKTFEVKDGGTGIGVAFRYQRDIAVAGLGAGLDLNAALDLRGQLAFDRDSLPEDFLEGRFGFDMAGNSGGEVVMTDAEKTALMSAGSEAATLTDPEAVDKLAEPWIEFLQKGGLTNQFSWGLAVNGGFEADQAFVSRNYTLGADLFLDWKPWDSSSTAAWFNLFDYPFALLRMLTGYDSDFRLRGYSFPALLAGLDRVLPDDPAREAAGDDSDYWRARAELSFKTPVVQVLEDVFFFSANYRWFQELSPSSTVEAAGLDQYSFLTLTFGGDEGVFVSYATGELPFGAQNAQVYELGWKLHF